ncbi:MAG: 50S ribosomal protein L6 [Gammaproteobacteria bacterium]|nr:50S ribosomal protein L6 [Gammaproteobacteria bacterium]MBI5617737.1 50S ribosomal protein L6 [Gammaproteobacteria bacterium]
MSRVAKKEIPLPGGVKVEIAGQVVKVTGPKGTLEHQVHRDVSVALTAGVLTVVPTQQTTAADMQAGTARAVLSNMVTGVSAGFVRKLDITGVGYRAQLKGKVLNIALGYSHPIDLEIPEGITIEVPSQTEILVKGVDKQQVGQIAANIRAFRPPEPYKGKGVRYANEQILRKEAKKS